MLCAACDPQTRGDAQAVACPSKQHTIIIHNSSSSPEISAPHPQHPWNPGRYDQPHPRDAEATRDSPSSPEVPVELTPLVLRAHQKSFKSRRGGTVTSSALSRSAAPPDALDTALGHPFPRSQVSSRGRPGHILRIYPLRPLLPTRRARILTVTSHLNRRLQQASQIPLICLRLVDGVHESVSRIHWTCSPHDPRSRSSGSCIGQRPAMCQITSKIQPRAEHRDEYITSLSHEHIISMTCARQVGRRLPHRLTMMISAAVPQENIRMCC